jgi:hypothetical protein
LQLGGIDANLQSGAFFHVSFQLSSVCMLAELPPFEVVKDKQLPGCERANEIQGVLYIACPPWRALWRRCTCDFHHAKSSATAFPHRQRRARPRAQCYPHASSDVNASCVRCIASCVRTHPAHQLAFAMLTAACLRCQRMKHTSLTRSGRDRRPTSQSHIQVLPAHFPLPGPVGTSRTSTQPVVCHPKADHRMDSSELATNCKFVNAYGEDVP